MILNWPNGRSAELVSVSYENDRAHEVWNLKMPTFDSLWDTGGVEFKRWIPEEFTNEY
jgi:hypothetical protein